MPRRHAVEDGGTAGHESLEARHAAAGVDEHVGGSDQVAHAIGEAEHSDAGVVAEAGLESSLSLVVAPGHAHDGRRLDVERAPNGTLEVADAPPAAGYERDAAGLGEVERAPGLARGALLEEGRRDERADLAGAARADELLDAPARAVVHDEMQVDSRVRPELEARVIEHRRADRRAQPFALAQPAEHRVDARVGRDDDIGRVRVDQFKQSRCADSV